MMAFVLEYWYHSNSFSEYEANHMFITQGILEDFTKYLKRDIKSFSAIRVKFENL